MRQTRGVKYDKKKLFFLSYFASLNCLIHVATGKGHSVVDIGAYERKEGSYDCAYMKIPLHFRYYLFSVTDFYELLRLIYRNI